MKPITSLISLESLTELASRGNLRYGKEIAKDGDIKLEQPNAFNITAQVKYKNHETRTVKIESTNKDLKWKCTCSNRKDNFCQHCVAVGLSLLDRSTV